MIKKLSIVTLLLLLCSACVNRTTYTTKGIAEGNKAETISDKKTIWFWDDDY